MIAFVHNDFSLLHSQISLVKLIKCNTISSVFCFVFLYWKYSSWLFSNEDNVNNSINYTLIDMLLQYY